MGVPKRRANDVDIINYQEKKEIWVAGLRKEGEKNSGARVRACEGEISKVSFPSPHAPENLFPFRKTAMQAKEKTANVWNH